MNLPDTTSAAPTADFGAVVALKAGDAVKSRLGVLAADVRRELARVMALDTLAALAEAAAALVIVSDRSDLEDDLRTAGISARVVPEPVDSRPETGGHHAMNTALQHGAEILRADGFATVLACVGDLPGLRASSVITVVRQLDRPGRAFVPDRSGTGTTMLIARQAALDPRFGGASAQAHQRSGATALTAPADARSDVDTVADLASTLPLGLGPRTTALIAASTQIRDALPPRS